MSARSCSLPRGASAPPFRPWWPVCAATQPLWRTPVKACPVATASCLTEPSNKPPIWNKLPPAWKKLSATVNDNARMVAQAVAQATNLELRAQTLVEGFASFKLQQGTPEEAIDLVMRAMQRWPGSAGRQSFVRDITDPAQRFFDRDMYVFVLDRRGTYLAFGGNPAKVGALVQDILGSDGQGLVDDIFEQAIHEPGWVEYDILNPVTGRVQSKMSYVVSADDLAVGCGVYKNLVTV